MIPGVIDASAASCARYAQFRSEPVHLSSVGRAFFVFRTVVGVRCPDDRVRGLWAFVSLF